MNYTVDWYPPLALRALRSFIGQVTIPGAIVELGSWEGRSAVALNDSMPTRRLVCVDCWDDDFAYRRFLENTAGRHITHHRMHWADFVADSTLWPQTIAILHIDMDHTYEQVSEQIRWGYDVVEPGGLLVGHDFSQSWPEVIRAVDELAPARIVNDVVWAVQV